jgi:alpha-glucosidase
MQSPTFTTCLKLLVITASITLTTALPAAERVVSPDGKVRVSIELKDGKPYWDVELGSNKIIAGGLLGLETETDNFSGSYQSLGIERVSGDTTWERVWGDTRAVRDHYNQITVKLRETQGQRRMWNAIVRVSNEGVGLRY